MLPQFRAPLSVNGERGLSARSFYRLLASRQWRSHRVPLVTRGTPVVPRRGLIAIPTDPPQNNQEDHGSLNEEVGSTPDGKGLESPDTRGDTEVSKQWADTEMSPMDIGSLYLDEEGFVEVRHKKPRRAEPEPPISPLAAQPSRADR